MPLKKAAYMRDATLGLELVVSAGSGIAYPEHNHVSTHTFVLVRSGLLRLRTGTEKRLLRPGDAFAVPPYRPHSLQTSSPYEIATLCIDKAILEQPEREERLAAVLAGLNRLRRNGQLTTAEIRTLKKLLSAATPHPTSPADDALETLKNELETNPAQPLDLDAMAGRVHMDKFHFIRKFKKRYGLTPRHFQNQNRLRQAKRFCRDGNPPVQAALQAGFYDQSHFNRACKTMTGLTPLQYRAACRCGF